MTVDGTSNRDLRRVEVLRIRPGRHLSAGATSEFAGGSEDVPPGMRASHAVSRYCMSVALPPGTPGESGLVTFFPSGTAHRGQVPWTARRLMSAAPGRVDCPVNVSVLAQPEHVRDVCPGIKHGHDGAGA